LPIAPKQPADDIVVSATLEHVHRSQWDFLPPTMRVLLVTSPDDAGRWLVEALVNDTATHIDVFQTVGVAEALTRLREETFDAVLVFHQPQELNALALLEGLRTSGQGEQPVIVLGSRAETEMAPLCFEAGADDYACVDSTTTRCLIWMIGRAIERHQLLRENKRLHHDRKRRLEQEHREAGQLLDQQRTLISDLERLRDGSPEVENEESAIEAAALAAFPQPVVRHYRELLRAYIVMGTGNLAAELERLVQALTASEMTAQQAMQLHLGVLEETVRDLGGRSARHVVARADLLVLEVMVHLAEGYRRRTTC
jgi:DNA-binding response OmpR family regulator